MCPRIASYSLSYFPRNWSKDDQPIVPWLSFLTCLKMDMTFVSPQSLGTRLGLHDFSKMMEKDHFTGHNETSLSRSCLSTSGCLPSGPVDWCRSRFLKRTLTSSSPTAVSFCPLSILCVLVRGMGEFLSEKWSNELQRYLHLLLLFSSKSMLSLFTANTAVEALLVDFNIPF